MLLGRSNSRGARGQSANRSRASRGRGAASRGASNSSSKSKSSTHSHAPNRLRVLQESHAGYHSIDRGRNPQPNIKRHYSSFEHAGTSPAENSASEFDLDRLENAAKREQRGYNITAVNGSGGRVTPRGAVLKQVRFADPLSANKEGRPSKSPSPAPSNPFASTSMPPSIETPATTPFNPFPTTKAQTSSSPFGTPSLAPNPFGAPSQSIKSSTTSAFGRPSGPPASLLTPEASQKPSTNTFVAPSNPFSVTPKTNGIFKNSSTSKASWSPPATNPFGTPRGSQPPAPSTTLSSSPAFAFGTPASNTPAASKPISNPPNTSPFEVTSSSKPPAFSANPFATHASTFGSPSSTVAPSAFGPSSGLGLKTTMDGFTPVLSNEAQSTVTPPNFLAVISGSSSALAAKMDQLLRKEGIVPPAWPTTMPGDPRQKGAIEAFWQTSKLYRSKVRASLIRAGLLDDPDKPKKLSEAIDFKGTCEDMCPDFEKITRIVEHDVQGAEKETAPDGSQWPSPHKMVKALARSAAGQDAPLPMDVRSPAALKRTLNYLLHTVLGENGDLPTVHGFLWDRTRAIRRDFVFQSSMSPPELSDQVYCLERITRFHVIALHQMSRDEVVAEDFSEQQEVEQLGKALLSLIHAYEDCQVQGIPCENEAEFRAYYVLFNSHNSGILETVQDWSWKFWGESDYVRTAVCLVETLQNIWDARGPLKPHSATDIAQNGYSRFFSIVEDKKLSYTMACFAEIHFNSVRKSALKTILASYRKQRDQTKDWSLTKLNAYLRFDNEEEVIDFGEAYGLQFTETDGETHLSFDSEDVSDPFPPLKQRHSYSLVERKRRDISLPKVIDATVYDEEDGPKAATDEESLFIEDTSIREKAKKASILPSSTITPHEDVEENTTRKIPTTALQGQPTLQNSDTQKPPSIFNQGGSLQTFGASSFTPRPVEPSLHIPLKAPQDAQPIFSKPSSQETPTTFAPNPQSKAEEPTSSFSVLNQPFTQPASENIKSSSSGQFITTASPQPNESPVPFLLGQQTVSTNPFVESPRPLLTLGQNSVVTTSTSTQAPLPNFFPAQHSITPHSHPCAKDATISVNPPSNQAKQLSLPQAFLGKGPTFSRLQNHPSNVKPRVSTPQSKPSLAPSFLDEENRAVGPSASPMPSVQDSQKPKLDNLAKWITFGDGGIIDHFTESQVENIVRGAVGIYLQERTENATKEENERAREQADQFRYRSLATKYGHRWREAAHRLWLRRRGREARKARQEMGENLRASKALNAANIVKDFRASTSNQRRGSLESLLDATGVLNGVHDSNSEVRAIVEIEPKPPTKRKRKSDRSTEGKLSTTISHKRGKSDTLRRSLLSDPAYLQGGSRIHLMSKYDVKDETRRQVSGVQTDYFRLKARGIATLPNGAPLANSVAKNIIHHKRSFDGISKPVTPRSSIPTSVTRSVPAKSMAPPERSRTSAEYSEDIQAMKDRAKALIAEDQDSRQKKRIFNDDELFARAKRVREQMDEGSAWYQMQRETASRSVS